MALKRQNKISAEFSMSSLTDIIFLLLIFFMLTATLVKINPFSLPESDNKTVAATSMVVVIDKAGLHYINNVTIETEQLETEFRKIIRSNLTEDFATVTIVAEVGTSFDHVLNVMQVANKLKLNAIVATQPKKS
jgi:biopolymer transport protein ExbD